jgi:hypothetical protein
VIETGLVPLFYQVDIAVASKLIETCLDAGVRCIEFTNRADQAHCVFQELVRHFENDNRAILGAGSVLDAPTAALYMHYRSDNAGKLEQNYNDLASRVSGFTHSNPGSPMLDIFSTV